MNRLFNTLIHPIEKEIFFKDYYEKTYLYLDDRSPQIYDNILTIKDIDNVLNIGEIPVSNILMTQKGTLPHSRWSKTKLNKGVYISKNKIAKELENGNSLVINNLDKYVYRLQSFVESLEKELLLALWTNIYITPPSFQAFNRHYDTHDVFILQIEGTKKWNLFDAPVRLPNNTQPYNLEKVDYSKMTPIKELTLKKGDFLYIPRGMVHEAIALGELSIHITLGANAPILKHLIDAIAKEALKDDFFRGSMFSGKENGTQFEFEFRKKLITLINNTPFNNLIESAKKSFKEKHFNNDNFNLLEKYITKQGINNKTKIRKIKNSDYTITLNGPILMLNVDSRVVEYPFFLKPVFDAILASENNGIMIENIKTSFNATEKIKLIKRLLADNIIEMIS